MAIKDIVVRGYGPSEVKFVPTRGYASSGVVAIDSQIGERWAGSVHRRRRSRARLVLLPFLHVLLRGLP